MAKYLGSFDSANIARMQVSALRMEQQKELSEAISKLKPPQCEISLRKDGLLTYWDEQGELRVVSLGFLCDYIGKMNEKMLELERQNVELNRKVTILTEARKKAAKPVTVIAS